MKVQISRNIVKLSGIIIFLLLSSFLFAGEIPAISDTTMQKSSEKVSTEDPKGQDGKIFPDNHGQEQRQLEAAKKDAKIKKINSSRPDMKARSARPPVISRPSGSKMPVGAGRPGGSVRPPVMKNPGRR
jgi:hypothetical protein